MVTRSDDPLDYSSAEELIEAELIALSVATAVFRDALALLTRQLFMVWPGDDAPFALKRAAILSLPFDRLLLQVQGITSVVRTVLVNAITIGVNQALAHAQASDFATDLDLDTLQLAQEVATNQRAIAGVSVSERVSSLTKDVVRAAREQVIGAKAVMTQAKTLQEAQVGLAVLNRGKTRIETLTRTAFHEAANAGTSSVVDSSPRLVLVWRSERNACVHCLAYSGQINRGDGYEGGKTFGKKPLVTGGVSKPPLHPNCRCDQIPVPIDKLEGPRSIPEVLKREAQRSILRGFSLESESNSVRIDAARRLLNKGVQAPKSVKSYAERAIRRGEFVRGRDLPEL